MMMAIPRSLIGLTEDVFTINFHWMDNVTDIYDLHSWFTTGDSAPERRNDYSLTLTVPYDKKAEMLLPPRTQDTIEYMPAVTLREADLQAGLYATLYTLPENYGKMPDFEHIAANAQTTALVTEISLAAAGEKTKDYALSFEGYVELPENGVYDFAIQASDCARVYIDGRLVTEVINPPAREANRSAKALGALPLAEGYHAIRIEYAEIGGHHPRLSMDDQWIFKA